MSDHGMAKSRVIVGVDTGGTFTDVVAIDAATREVQQALLPQSYPSFPHTAKEPESALRFAHRYLPEGRVGGDFFTVIPISDTQAGVLVCDPSVPQVTVTE